MEREERRITSTSADRLRLRRPEPMTSDPPDILARLQWPSRRSGRETADRPGPQPRTGKPSAIPSMRIGRLAGSKDARWILAVETTKCLEGPMLRFEKRQRLIRMGQEMGLTAFDANLIIAVVQDLARRGYPSQFCALVGEPQLAMIAPPEESVFVRWRRLREVRQRLYTACFLGAFIAGELALIWMVLR